MASTPSDSSASASPSFSALTAGAEEHVKLHDLKVFYGAKQALHGVTLGVPKHHALALIGPSGCGKSTLIKVINRISLLNPDVRVEGDVTIGDQSIFDSSIDVIALRQRVGMVFQKPNPFGKSIYENVAYGLRIHGVRDRAELDFVVEWALRHAALWDEVKDRLHSSALALSGGQQQRLCIARALAVQPEVLLMDEPCSALDPIATAKIEELIQALKREYTILIVTHNMQQAGRVSDFTALLWLGKLVEFNRTSEIFTNPREKLTEDYITGRSG